MKHKRRWTPEEEALIKNHYPEKNSRELAAMLGRSQRAVMHRISALKKTFNKETDAIRFEEYPGNDIFLISSDWHVPNYDEDLALNLLATAEEQKINKLIIPGDFLNLDILSKFVSYPYPLEKELKNARDLLSLLLETFQQILFIPGNHERRIIRKLNTLLPWELFTNLITDSKQVLTTPRDYLILTTPTGSWRVCHPENYSRTKGSVAVQLADLYHQHIIAGHSHHLGLNISKSGLYVAIDCGGLFDEKKIEYVQGTNLLPGWNQGYVILDHGKPELVSPLYKKCSNL